MSIPEQRSDMNAPNGLVHDEHDGTMFTMNELTKIIVAIVFIVPSW
jgi:hypothetical protein